MKNPVHMHPRFLQFVLGLIVFLLPFAFVQFAQADASASIQSLTPGTSVTTGTTVYFQILTNGFVNPTYTVSDFVPGTTITNSNINTYGEFSWIPTTADIGTHNLTIAISDSSGNHANLFEQFVVTGGQNISIQSLTPSNATVSLGSSVSFFVSTPGFTNPVFSIRDSYGGTTISNNNISSNGNFTWTPTQSDSTGGGVHDITITATDSLGHTSSVSQTITVLYSSTLMVENVAPSSTIGFGTPLTFSVPATGLVNPTYSVGDTFTGTSVTDADIDQNGNFHWTPNPNDVGVHNITIQATDSSGHSETATQQIIVQNPSTTTGGATAQVEYVSPNTTITYGTPLSFLVFPTGFSNPTFTVTDSFGGSSVTSANINSGGSFNWTPNPNDVGIHNLTILVGDPLGHSATANEQIIVEASPGVMPTQTSTTITAGAGCTVGALYSTTTGALCPTITSSGVPGCSAGALYSTTTGASCATQTLNVPGCSVGDLFSVTTGASCAAVTAPTVVPGCVAGSVYSSTTGAYCGATTTVTPTAPTSVTTTTTSTSSGYNFTQYLSPGSTGPDVTALQNILIKQGLLTGSATGYYGDMTEQAVEQLQTNHSLDSLGVVGPQTRALLNQMQSTKGDGFVFNNPLDVGATGNDVTELQQRLTVEGVYSGPITGYYGSLTQTAVEQYQGAHNLQQLGNVGPGTRAALNSGL